MLDAGNTGNSVMTAQQTYHSHFIQPPHGYMSLVGAPVLMSNKNPATMPSSFGSDGAGDSVYCASSQNSSSGSCKSSGHGGDSPPFVIHQEARISPAFNQNQQWQAANQTIVRNESTDSGGSYDNNANNYLYFEVAGAGSETDVPVVRGAISDSVTVPSSEHVAEIVGRQGCKIKALRAKTNTYIKTPVRGEDPTFVITGKPADVSIAKKEIEEAADHFTQIRASRKHSQGAQTAPGHITAYVRVPFRVVGLVVGPRGATIKRIQQDTHTYIITPGRECEPLFEVTGLPPNVQKAKALIEEHILARTGVKPLSYNDENGDFHANTQPMDAIALAFAEAKQPSMAAPGTKIPTMLQPTSMTINSNTKMLRRPQSISPDPNHSKYIPFTAELREKTYGIPSLPSNTALHQTQHMQNTLPYKMANQSWNTWSSYDIVAQSGLQPSMTSWPPKMPTVESAAPPKSTNSGDLSTQLLMSCIMKDLEDQQQRAQH